MLVWRVSPKGYVLYVSRFEPYTIFWSSRPGDSGWLVKHGNAPASGPFTSVFGAVDHAEGLAGVKASRAGIRDVPVPLRAPEDRPDPDYAGRRELQTWAAGQKKLAHEHRKMKRREAVAYAALRATITGEVKHPRFRGPP